MTLKGRLPRSTNATFLVEVALEATCALAVYKPERGERPLWDFPPGLFKRELAAYHLSETLGWGLVPLTVRRDGPYGEGSLRSSCTRTSPSTTSRSARSPRTVISSPGSARSI